jgi:hypothetical protein
MIFFFYFPLFRLFWLFSLLSSLALTLILITKLIIKVKIDPVIVLIQDHQIPVSEIDFPAITICRGLIQKMPGFVRTPNGFWVGSEIYERHSNKMLRMERLEFLSSTIDERRLKSLSYTDMLDRIERSAIDITDLRIKT